MSSRTTSRANAVLAAFSFGATSRWPRLPYSVTRLTWASLTTWTRQEGSTTSAGATRPYTRFTYYSWSIWAGCIILRTSATATTDATTGRRTPLCAVSASDATIITARFVRPSGRLWMAAFLTHPHKLQFLFIKMVPKAFYLILVD